MIASLYEPFKKWSEKGSVYIISDPHFEDPDCKIMDSRWPSPQEYVDKINKTVSKTDTLICLGDCGKPQWFNKIKAGYKVLIKGNHDRGNSNYTSYFNEIYAGPLIISPKIILSHEPIFGLTYLYNIHGHKHDQKSEWEDCIGGKHLNIAANVINWELKDLKTIIKSGVLNKIDDIHRQTIDYATLNSKRD